MPHDTAHPSVLIFDNTKFAFANYQAAVEELVAGFDRDGIAVSVMTRSIRGDLGVGLTDLADELVSTGCGAIVVGFADAGVTPATTRLALEVVDRGVTAVVLAGDPGMGLVRQVAQYQAPDLPIVHLPLRPWLSADEVTSVARASFADVARAIATSPALRRRGAVETTTVPLDADASELFRWLVARGLSDGLPVIAPTPALVEAMLGGFEPRRVLIAAVAPKGQNLTVADAATAAVLAGCGQEHFVFVVTALEAMAAPQFALWQAATSTNPSSTVIVASGPATGPAGLYGGQGCLGPGFRANATIGRAVNLAMLLAGGATPGVGNLATQGSPAQYTFCFAENLVDSPWQGLHADVFSPEVTSVTVFHGEGPHDVVWSHGLASPQSPADPHATGNVHTNVPAILTRVASASATLGSNNAYRTSELMVILCPGHAETIVRAGWTKADVQEYLFETVRLPAAAVNGEGQGSGRPDWANQLDPVPAILSPDAVTVVVAGGYGNHSSVMLPWTMNRSVTMPLTTGNQ